MAAQLCIFPDITKIKTKRVHYKTATYHKQYKNDAVETENAPFIKDDIALWGGLNEVYKQIANFFPITTLKNESRTIEIGCIRLWIESYKREKYDFKGKEYKGQEFKVYTAEVIGSEDMRADKRLKLHKEVLEMLKAGKDMCYIEKMVKERLQKENG